MNLKTWWNAKSISERKGVIIGLLVGIIWGGIALFITLMCNSSENIPDFCLQQDGLFILLLMPFLIVQYLIVMVMALISWLIYGDADLIVLSQSSLAFLLSYLPIILVILLSGLIGLFMGKMFSKK